MIPIVNFDSNLFLFYGEDDDTAKVSLVVVVGVSVGSSGYDMVQSYFLYVVSFLWFLAPKMYGNFGVTYYQIVYAECVPLKVVYLSLPKYI